MGSETGQNTLGTGVSLCVEPEKLDPGGAAVPQPAAWPAAQRANAAGRSAELGQARPEGSPAWGSGPQEARPQEALRFVARVSSLRKALVARGDDGQCSSESRR